MLVRFADRKLERLEVDPGFRAGFGPDVVKQFRHKMAIIRAALDERAFYALKSLHYEKLKGSRSHQRSMRLNSQFRLIVEIEVDPERVVVVVSVEDYH
jgi:proteic killer suppression protein